MTKPVFIRGIGQGAKFIVVIVGLVLLFKEKITDIVKTILAKMASTI